MKLAIYSDIHLEFAYMDGQRLLEGDPDVVILAGDISTGVAGIHWAKELGVPVIYVAGNHEYYHHDFYQHRETMRKHAEDTTVHFLDGDNILIDDVLFIGATLWTDYKLLGDAHVHKAVAHGALNDHRLIRNGDRFFTPDDASIEFIKDRSYIEDSLRTASEANHIARVVVTHHAPHGNSIQPKFAGDKLNPAFASDLSDVIQAHDIDLWVHGHDHGQHDYSVYDTRVVSAQRGYPTEASGQVLNIEV
jgi:Icc-related predicted phosphoesterase